MQWHLLEHAFDAFLEAGEIPSPLYFTEMVLQTTARQDYKRAVTLVNAMALAPFQVSEEQWKELFEKNRDRISQNNLEKLLDSLDNCDMKSEATVVNLSKALNSFCGSDTSGELFTSIVYGSELYNSSLDGSEEITFTSHFEESIDEDPDSDEDLPLNISDVPFEASSVVQASSSTDITCMEVDHNTDRERDLLIGKMGFSNDEASDEFSDSLHGKLSTVGLTENCEDVDEMELEPLLNEVVDSGKSNLPSAYEVLEAWKENKRKDGVLFSFRLGQR